MTAPTLTKAQEVMLATAADAELGSITLTAPGEARTARKLEELGLLRHAGQSISDKIELRRSPRPRYRITIRGDELARHLARRDLGIDR